MEKSDQITAITKAIAQAQREIKPAIKDGKNPHFKSKHLTLQSIWEAIQEPLTSRGICIVQDTKTETNGVSVETWLLHESGEWLKFGPFTIPVSKNDAQAFGSASTYVRRYALCSCLCIVSEDDDAEGAMSRETLTQRAGVNTNTGEIAPVPPNQEKNSPETAKSPQIYLTFQQVHNLKSLIDSVKANEQEFLKWMQVRDLKEIKFEDYSKAWNALNQKAKGKE